MPGNYLYIESEIEIKQINIINLLGEAILQIKEPTDMIDLSGIIAGMYIIQQIIV